MLNPKTQNRRFAVPTPDLKGVFENLGFRDGLVWTVDLTVEKPRFRFLQIDLGENLGYFGLKVTGILNISNNLITVKTLQWQLLDQ